MAPVPVYDRGHFVAKFERIPDARWCTAAFRKRGACCALGHCGADYGTDPTNGLPTTVHTAESRALCALFSGHVELSSINDGIGVHAALGDTPRDRILAALRGL